MKEFFGNVKQELRKITWPTDAEMKKYSVQVFVFMIVLSLFFAGIDAVISFGVSASTTTEPFVPVPPIVEEYDYDYGDDYGNDYGDDYSDDYGNDGDNGDEETE